MKPRPSSLMWVLTATAAVTCALLSIPSTARAQPAMRKAEVKLLEGDEFALMAQIEDELRAARTLLYKPDRVLDDYTRARDHLDAALALDPGRARTWFEVAELYRHGIDASQAWPYYEEFLELATERDVDWAHAHSLLAERALDAVRGLNEVPDHLLDEAERHLLAAYEVYREQHNGGAMADLEDALRVVATMRGELEAALRYAYAAMEHTYEGRFFMAIQIASLLSRLDRDEEALAWLEELPADVRAQSFDPIGGQYALSVSLADIHRRLGHHDTALQYLDLLEMDLKRVEQHYIDMDGGLLSASHRAFFDDKYSGIYGSRASVYIDMGDYDSGEAEFRKAYGLAPGEPGSLNNLAWVLAISASLNDPKLEEAEQLAREAVSLEPSAAYLDTLAEVLMRREKYSEALEVIDQAFEQAPDSTYLHSQRRRIERIQAGEPLVGGSIEMSRPWQPPRGASL